MRIEWKKAQTQYTSGLDLVVGNKWTVGYVGYSAFISKDDPNKYKATCKLPGIKSDFGHFATEKEAQAVIERAVNYWFEKATAEI